MSTAYQEFLETKVAVAPQTGLDVDVVDIHPALKPHQRDMIRWAVHGGRRALFASFGLGKSLMQMEICRLIHQREGGKTLIVCPLGVRQEFLRDSALGVELNARYHVDAVVYCREVEKQRDVPTLFDLESLGVDETQHVGA